MVVDDVECSVEIQLGTKELNGDSEVYRCVFYKIVTCTVLRYFNQWYLLQERCGFSLWS